MAFTVVRMEKIMSLSKEPRSRKTDPAEERPKVQRSSRGKNDARDALLDTAERLFADNGYDGASLRDIAGAASQHLALSQYYFGTKEGLFEAVIKRRAIAIVEIRLAALAEINVTAMPPSDAARALIEAYSLPVIRASYGPSKPWRAHFQLMSRMVNTRQWVPLIRKYYDHCGLAFLAGFQEALPHADHNSLRNSFSFMISNLIYVCSYDDRLGKMKKDRPSSKREILALTEDFLRYTHAGFMAL
jgi:AcrR family transcriptional regulator